MPEREIHASVIYDKCSHEQFRVKMPGVKCGRQSFNTVLDAQLIDLFHSDTEDEDFDGFWTELIAFEMSFLLNIWWPCEDVCERTVILV